jgi:hypothetical protein
MNKLLLCITKYSASYHVNGSTLVQKIQEGIAALRSNTTLNISTISQLDECKNIAEALYTNYLEGKVCYQIKIGSENILMSCVDSCKSSTQRIQRENDANASRVCSTYLKRVKRKVRSHNFMRYYFG